jgi:hypothetical protein
MNRVYLFLIVIMTVSCIRSGRHLDTEKIEKGLYFERYIDNSGGAFASTYVHNYLTDSVNFNKYIGSSDENQYTIVKKYLNGVNIFKYEGKNRILVDSIFYNTDILKSENEFDNITLVLD